ncbi:hypothetical protein CE91St19_26440 [Odoribacter laneus]|jgi:phosphoglycerate mutase|uniref:Alpha-ribazole phosphatase n=1 Tax=Odoribacter laneus YIT 12061 TaxID=742817 RepID=H1DKD6_9BACT|nr:alpha-ribazole phosphatase family protein [Odoribacter laneus]EHP45750.1 alpha-ribazole phosphatase [Odoribacter laneus YIT 12061]GKI23242.1 hypothetical protein CE91St19_26440 [Odoribacter laneus]GKI25342.1 hypothetical protein CE91St20_14790 [Odoribacter laneus]
MQVTLIRHTSVAVETGTIYGFTDVNVANSFPTEAREVAQNLAQEQFDAVYSSPMSRCTKLSAYCGYPHPILDERLKELNFGNWEMQNWATLQDPLLQEWYSNWIHIPAGGGESFMNQYQRVRRFLDELRQKPFRHVCLFVHSGTIRCAHIYAGMISFTEAFSKDIPYGGRSDIQI